MFISRGGWENSNHMAASVKSKHRARCIPARFPVKIIILVDSHVPLKVKNSVTGENN